MPCDYPRSTRRNSYAISDSSTATQDPVTGQPTASRDFPPSPRLTSCHDPTSSTQASQRPNDGTADQIPTNDFEMLDGVAEPQSLPRTIAPSALEGSSDDIWLATNFDVPKTSDPSSSPDLIDNISIGTVEPRCDVQNLSPIFNTFSDHSWQPPESSAAVQRPNFTPLLEDGQYNYTNGFTCTDDSGCNALVIGILDNISGWRRLDSLLEILSAIRVVIHRLDSLSDCPRCQNGSTFITMLLILAEKLLDQIQDLLTSKKSLTSGVSLGGCVCFGEYQIETDEERWVVYSALLSHNIYLLQTILARLSNHAKTMKWSNHSESLDLLLVRSTRLNTNIRHRAV